MDKLSLAGCLLLAPLGLCVWAAIQGMPYTRCIVAPADAAWSFNPFFNIWPVSLVIALVFAVLAAVEAARQGRSPREMAKTIGMGFIGGGVVGAVGLSMLVSVGALLNARLDSGPPALYRAQVIDKVTKSDKFGRYAYLVVQDWRGPAVPPVLVCAGDNRQGSELSRVIQVAAPVNISTGPGFLGLEWVIAVEPALNSAEQE